MGKGRREGLCWGCRALLKVECGDGITSAYLGQNPSTVHFKYVRLNYMSTVPH